MKLMLHVSTTNRKRCVLVPPILRKISEHRGRAKHRARSRQKPQPPQAGVADSPLLITTAANIQIDHGFQGLDGVIGLELLAELVSAQQIVDTCVSSMVVR